MPQTISRMCALTRQVLPKRDLVRFVRRPDGTVQLDVHQNLPGRGLYVRKDAQTIESFCAPKKRQLWTHLLKCEISPEVQESMCQQMRQANFYRDDA